MRSEKKNSNVALRVIISIIIAIALWFAVDLQNPAKVARTFKEIPVEFSGEDTTLMDKGLMITSGYDTYVDVKLKAPRNILAKLSNDNIHIACDTTQITGAGEQTLNWSISYTDTQSPASISLIDASSFTVTVGVKELYTKDVPVYCDVIGEIAEGYSKGDLSLDPEYITLRAEENDLLNVSYAKVSINVNNATASIVETLSYQLYDYNDSIVENSNIRSSVKSIQVLLPIRTTKEVPLTVKVEDSAQVDPSSYTIEITPKTVTLLGEADKLNDINSISIGSIFIAEIVGVQPFNNIQIVPPAGTYIISDVTTASYTVTVKGAEDRTYSVENVSLENLSASYKASCDPINVVLSGSGSELDRVNISQIHCSIDMKDVTGPGEYQLPVQVKIDNQDFVAVKGTYTVKVKVEASE